MKATLLRKVRRRSRIVKSGNRFFLYDLFVERTNGLYLDYSRAVEASIQLTLGTDKYWELYNLRGRNRNNRKLKNKEYGRI